MKTKLTKAPCKHKFVLVGFNRNSWGEITGTTIFCEKCGLVVKK
ncbi:MAG: hypothetical protein WC479_03145 [Candidatus Izemoplasmatales bacterium]